MTQPVSGRQKTALRVAGSILYALVPALLCIFVGHQAQHGFGGADAGTLWLLGLVAAMGIVYAGMCLRRLPIGKGAVALASLFGGTACVGGLALAEAVGVLHMGRCDALVVLPVAIPVVLTLFISSAAYGVRWFVGRPNVAKG